MEEERDGLLGPWYLAGIVFLIGLLVMSFMLFQKVDSHYISKNMEWNDEDVTRNDYCDEFHERHPDSTSTYCQDLHHDVYTHVWYWVMTLGITLMCFAQASNIGFKFRKKYDWNKIHEERYANDPLLRKDK